MFFIWALHGISMNMFEQKTWKQLWWEVKTGLRSLRLYWAEIYLLRREDSLHEQVFLFGLVVFAEYQNRFGFSSLWIGTGRRYIVLTEGRKGMWRSGHPGGREKSVSLDGERTPDRHSHLLPSCHSGEDLAENSSKLFACDICSVYLLIYLLQKSTIDIALQCFWLSCCVLFCFTKGEKNSLDLQTSPWAWSLQPRRPQDRVQPSILQFQWPTPRLRPEKG